MLGGGEGNGKMEKEKKGPVNLGGALQELVCWRSWPEDLALA